MHFTEAPHSACVDRAIAEGRGAKHASYALKLLQSQGTLTMASTGKHPASGKLITQEYRVEGTVALMGIAPRFQRWRRARPRTPRKRILRPALAQSHRTHS